jgi:archaellum component FlaG (FlaF/FlaG flagellin family)
MRWNWPTFFGSARPSRRPHSRRSRPRLEAFEDRIVPSADVLTYHNDLARTGANLNETILTPSNVNATDFGKQFSYAVDGQVYASPLYKTSVVIAGQGTFNVVYVATEHDSVYAFDADSNTSGPSGDGLLWKDSFLGTGITPFSTSDAYGCGQISPEIGITATPVIDPDTGTLYVVAQTKEVVGTTTTYHQKLHALDLATGEEKFGGPVEITASVPGTGDGGTTVTFHAQDYKERAGLVLSNGVIYTSWASHCDINPSGRAAHGWVIGYDASTLQQTSVFCTSPNGNLDTIWQGNGSLAVDADGNLYFETGNGSAGPSNGNYNEAFVKLSPAGGLHVVDYFIPSNWQALDQADRDIGSGAPIVLPDAAGSAQHPHLLVGAGKDGRIFLLDRDDMGGLHTTDMVVQELPNGTIAGGSWDTPAYFMDSNGDQWIYYAGNGDRLKAFSVADAQLSTSPTSQSANSFTGNYGATPVISANGTTNGIVWAVREGSPAVLYAYDATNLANQLYNSSQAGTRDQLGTGTKFFTPTVAGGKVFVATQGANTLTVFGLFNQPLDPGFETPSVGTGTYDAFQYQPGGSPWTFDAGSGVAGNGSGFTAGNPDAPDGTQVAFLQATGSASQAVTFAAGTYSVSFLAAQRGNGNFSSQTFQVLVDGNVVGTFTPPDTSYTAYNTNSFTVTAGSHTVEFVGLDPDGQDNTAFIDQVRVNRVLTLLSDPGFETPNVGTGTYDAFQYQPSGSPWTFGAGAGVAGNGSGFTAGNPDAPQGTQVAFLQATGSLSQAVTFAAGTYSLSFQAAQRGNGNASSQTFQVLVDGNVVGNFMPGFTSYTAYTTAGLTLTAGSHTIQFVGLDPDGQDNTAFIDQVLLFG